MDNFLNAIIKKLNKKQEMSINVSTMGHDINNVEQGQDNLKGEKPWILIT